MLLAFPIFAANPKVTLAWDPSPASDVKTYRIYYGVASQAYSDMVTVGNVTEATITNLVPGAKFYFTATAVDAIGLESEFSNEVRYDVPVQPPPTVQLAASLAPEGQIKLNATAAAGQVFDVMSTTDLKNWKVISSGTAAADGSLSFVDPAGITNRQCFYRLRAR
jgi:hypothetical protein